MNLEKTQNVMGWVIASLIPLGILSYFFPAFERLFFLAFAAVVIFFIWEKEQQLTQYRKELWKLKNEKHEVSK